ncbi:chitooligosaccharidolytic beta-N-acetylglucosaminidase-like [Macrobrachium nipponense]|uniref:chitooligosaccharidolytic beta-N-acetylglucosaminidase-like n=1 Tax=Macrobrachium nipponense TaxID=159736 RepID=UPI0030C7C478
MDKIKFINVLLVGIFLFVPGSLATFALPSPWGYTCNSATGKCVKAERTGISSSISLSRCKLACGKEGVLWPKPTSVNLDGGITEFLPSNVTLSFTVSTEEVERLLQQATGIFKENLQMNHPEYVNGKASWEGFYDPATVAHVLHLDITVSGVDTRLKLETDESYSLSIATSGAQSTATIIAASYFGARHALETLSQLIAYEENTNALLLVSKATIGDSPVFPYRGILLDTSRNFYPVEAIERTLDAMAANKLNTFHWHVTDSHSFPIYLENLPKMTYYGAYSSSQIYHPADVKHIVEYGRVRGIRVLPELDAPAHVGNGFQWGPQHGLGNLAVCVNEEPWQSFCLEPPCGQLNLANEKMYEVLGQIYRDLINLFQPLDLFHFGGDEINLACWNSTKEIMDWMNANGFGTSEDAYYEQWSKFQEKALQLLTIANNNAKIPGILWTSHLTEKGRADLYLPKKDYIIQIWTEHNDSVIGELLDKKYRVIFSNYDHWYLDCGVGAWIGEGNNWCSPYKGWQTVYDNSPIEIARALASTPLDTSLILGGEAALWSEQADAATLDSKLWPRGSALAERLWSNPSHNWEAAQTRLIHHRQRLVQRGIQAERIQPEWCHQNEGLCNARKES